MVVLNVFGVAGEQLQVLWAVVVANVVDVVHYFAFAESPPDLLFHH